MNLCGSGAGKADRSANKIRRTASISMTLSQRPNSLQMSIKPSAFQGAGYWVHTLLKREGTFLTKFCCVTARRRAPALGSG